MKITIKTLQQKAFSVVIDEDETVLTLKERIETEQGSGFPAAGLKLIYAGKILNDGHKIGEYNIQETSFVVVMVSKGKTPSSQASTSSTSASTPSTSAATPDTPAATTTTAGETTQTQSTPIETTPQQETTPTADRVQQSTPVTTTPVTTTPVEQTDTTGTTPIQTQSSVQESAASTLAVGEDYNSAIARLTELGFSVEQAKLAMEKCYNNPDRAADYLLEHGGTVTPEPMISEEMVQQPPPQGSSDLQQPPSGELVGGASSGEELFQHLSQIPQFAMLRERLQAHPRMLPALLQQIQQTNPDLFTLISQNQQEFLQLINSEGVTPGAGGGGGGPTPGAGHSPGTFSIQVTTQEKEAIERLKSMGFPETRVVQAYFACDKNEELAANFLLQEKEED